MITPIILTTTSWKETLKRRKKDGLPLRDCGYLQVMLDTYDICRVIEVPEDDDDVPICQVSYLMETHVKDNGENLIHEVQHINVRHSMTAIYEKMEEAKREKKEWEE